MLLLSCGVEVEELGTIAKLALALPTVEASELTVSGANGDEFTFGTLHASKLELVLVLLLLLLLLLLLFASMRVREGRAFGVDEFKLGILFAKKKRINPTLIKIELLHFFLTLSMDKIFNLTLNKCEPVFTIIERVKIKVIS